MPNINEEELKLVELPHISRDCISRSYALVNHRAELLVFQHQDSGAFIAGSFVRDDFIPITEVTVKKHDYPGAVIPTQMAETWFQVSFVHVCKQFAERAFTRTAYEFIAAKTDLVSDRRQKKSYT